jgi:6-pyruvoyltetrahydropterin/6-carboxytetrahydropterin synthase
MEIIREFTFEAAHLLPNVPLNHKCRRLHGHSYRVEVYLRGPIDVDMGWVTDFADIKTAFQPVHDQLDHRYLNDIDGLSNPTSENLARWIWQKLRPSLTNLSKIVVRETCTTGCIYSGEDEPQ